jgi:putative effector of murein hydrolase
MGTIFYSPLMGVILTVGFYLLAVWLHKKTKLVILNPILVSTVAIIATMVVFDISLEQYNKGASVVQVFLAPATCAIALSIYRQRKILKAYFIPVITGCVVSSGVSIGLSFVLGKMFGLDEVITNSLVPSSVTSAIAIDVAEQLNGIVPVAILCVVITGVAGAIFAPLLIKIFNVKDAAEMGVSIGASSHIVGTSKAVELGEIQGAMSGVAIGIAGLTTVFLTLFL